MRNEQPLRIRGGQVCEGDRHRPDNRPDRVRRFGSGKGDRRSRRRKVKDPVQVSLALICDQKTKLFYYQYKI